MKLLCSHSTKTMMEWEQRNFFPVDSSTPGFKPNQQIPGAPIPEPATLSLLGLGALALIRRKRS
ncbi:MAG: PEP-CTERM sorting domain-containing protein [Kiritimatiellia bacterium]